MRGLVLTLVLAAAIACPAAAATHPSLQIKPVSLTLDAAHAIGQLSMSSLSAQTVIFDLQTVTWQQSGDNDSFAPTSDLMVVPSVYDIQPFRTMLVRVGLREPLAELKVERAFQVQFREVLAPGTAGEGRTLTAPVFIAPSAREGEMRYTVQRGGALEARLEVKDDANVHAYLGHVRLRSGDHEVFSGTLDAYVLAGNSRSFILTLERPIDAAKVEMSIRNGDRESTADVLVR